MYIERNVSTALIIATQPHIEEDSLKYHLEQRDKGQQLQVDARRMGDVYYLLDGHNRAVTADITDGVIDVCVHEHSQDYDPTKAGQYMVAVRWESVEGASTFGTIPEFRRNVHHWLREERWVRSQLGIPAPLEAALEKKEA